MDVGQVRQRRLSDDIVERLETMILEGALKAGERLPAERVLAERFGVSRPSLREAIQKLVARYIGDAATEERLHEAVEAELAASVRS